MVESYAAQPPIAPVAIAAHSLSIKDPEEIFHISRTYEIPPWTTPVARIHFSDCFRETCSLN